MAETDTRATLDLSVSGMTCGSCVRHVQDALAAVEGVDAARVDLPRGRATVSYDPSRATAERLIAAVEDAGYRAAVGPEPATPAIRPLASGLPIRSGCGCSSCAS